MAAEQKQHKEEPIIIKKKKGHGGHGGHGGAWKVAYADFVTAMMAFFIVMWILGQSEEVKKSVTSYFNDPGAFSFISGKRAVPIDLNLKPSNEGDGNGKGGQDSSKKKDGFVFWLSNELQDSLIEKIKEQAMNDSVSAAHRVEKIKSEVENFLKEQMTAKPDLKDLLTSIKIEMTKEGLRIELIESSESMFFELGSSNVKPKARELLVKLGQEIGKLPNQVDIEGHTDSRKYAGKAVYSNWELSSDRANASRRVLESNGFWEGQVDKVTGFADRRLRNNSNPFDISNRRVSILVKQMSAKDFIPEEYKAGK
ncbi:MAG: OmpA family protein [Ignavibacteriae bacterium]|nr:OmpA family protein [Ignavibacteriota bacterium]